MIKRRPKKHIKRYIPVFISVILFAALVCLLAYLLCGIDFYQKQTTTTQPKKEKTTVRVANMLYDTNLTCSSEINKKMIEEANNLTFDFTTVDTILNPCSNSVVDDEYCNVAAIVKEITIGNIPADLELEILDSYTGNIVPYASSMVKDGKFIFNLESTRKVSQLYIVVRSKNEDCKNEIVRKFSTDIPALNYYKDTLYCQDERLKDFEYCQEFTWNDFTDKEFEAALKKYKKDNNIE